MLGIELGEQLREVRSREGPAERLGNLLVALLKSEQTFLDLEERNEVVGSECLTLKDREVDFDLVEPARVDGGVHQDDGGPFRPQALAGFLPTVRCTVVDDPEDTAGRAVGFLGHDLRHQSIEGLDAGGLFATSEDSGAMDIPSREVGPGSRAFVFMFDAGRSTIGQRERGVFTQTRLYAGFLIGREDEVTAAKRQAFPAPLVEVEHSARLGAELGIAGKDPASVPPWTERVAAEPAPKRRAADLGNDSLGDDLALNLAERETRQRKAESMRKLAGERLNFDDDAGGKSAPARRLAVVPRDPGNPVRRSACATYSRSVAAYRGVIR